MILYIILFLIGSGVGYLACYFIFRNIHKKVKKLWYNNGIKFAIQQLEYETNRHEKRAVFPVLVRFKQRYGL